jgi:hypothetical protein
MFLAIDSSVEIICYLYEWQFCFYLWLGTWLKVSWKILDSCVTIQGYERVDLLNMWSIIGEVRFQAVWSAENLQMNANIARRPDGTRGPQQSP